MNTNAIQQRDNFTRILSEYQRIDKGNVRLTESSLMLIQPFDANKSKITFPVLDSDQKNSDFIEKEIRLNMNDEFIILQMGIYLFSQFRSNEIQISPYRLLSYPPIELGVNNIPYFEFYQTGKLRIAVNNVVFMENYDVQKHLCVQRQQFENFATEPQVFVNNAKHPDFKGDRDGMYAIEPNIVLSGAVKNEITIEYNEGLSTTTSSWRINDAKIVQITIAGVALVLRGFLAQNAAKFQ